MAFIHRFGSTLNAHLHFHCVVIDGVFDSAADGVVFHAASDLDGNAVAQVQQAVRQRLLRGFVRRGLLPEDDAQAMAQWEHGGGFSVDASVGIAAGDRAGRSRGPAGGDATPERDAAPRSRSRAAPPRPDPQRGPSGDAPGRDRAARERLLRYCARPPFALDRLRELDPEHLLYERAKPGPDGTGPLRLTPLELLDRLAALIPPPRAHRHRSYGVLAPNAPLRAAVTALAPVTVPTPPPPPEPATAEPAPRRAARYA